MFRKFLVPAVLLAALVTAIPAMGDKSSSPSWSMNATIIEACSCPMFCQCYFSTEPAGHHDMSNMSGGSGGETHYCRFNNAFRINKGSYGKVKLDGAKFWVYGDLGGDFSKGQMEWAVATFDKSLTKEQRDGITAILGHVYPVKWSGFSVAEGTIDWQAGNDDAWATLDGGKSAEVRLTTKSLSRGSNGKPMVIENLKYWGAPRNDGFILMPNTVEAVRVGDKQFEFKGTNGFMITIDANSKDVM